MNKFFKILSFSAVLIFTVFTIFSIFKIQKIEANTGTISLTSFTSYLCADVACTTGSRIVWSTTNGSAVSITDTALTGNLWGEDVGWISLSGTNYGVTNTVLGVLNGYAWGENTGWINFKPTNGGVSINTTTGEFSGWAWAQNYGWIKFECPGANTCVDSDWQPTDDSPPDDGGGGGGGGDDDEPTFCELNPSDPSCVSPTFCVLYPTHPSCIVLTFCELYPSNPFCDAPTFCEQNPSDPSCVTQTFCELNPSDPACVTQTFCELNPSDVSCLGLTFCELNPSDSSCISLPPCEGTDCLSPELPEEPQITEENNIITETVDDMVSVINSINLSSPQEFLLNNFSPEQIGKLDIGLKIGTIGSAFLGGTVSLASILFLNPITGSELLLIPFRLWSLLLTALGLKKRVKPWGTVYDSVTKQPLDPVYVSLINLEGQEVTSSITDIDGRYGFYAEPGVYKVVPKKTNYIFPSNALANHFQDEFYQDLYFGDYMNIGAGQIIVNNIPMDPVNFDWNEFAKNKKQLFKFYSKRELIIARISNILFGIGFGISAVSLILFPEIYNIAIFGFYILIFVLRRTKFKLRAKGRVVDSDGSPLSYAFIRVFSAATGVEIAHKVLDNMGRYHMLVPNGKYYVKIEKKNSNSTYSLVYTSEPLEVMHGTLNKVFNI